MKLALYVLISLNLIGISFSQICFPNPCLNNGTCSNSTINNSNVTSNCSCPINYYGLHCEYCMKIFQLNNKLITNHLITHNDFYR